VIAFDSLRKGRSYWNVQCDCGEIKTLRIDGMHDYSTCDKCKAEKQRQRMLTHGETKTSLYKTWQGIKERCYNSNSTIYKYYGGRGITVCEEWLDNFLAFYNWSIENGYTNELTIERKDVDGNYCPENCRWATQVEQANNKNNNHLLTFNGESHTIAEWGRITEIPEGTIERRINRQHWSIERALTEVPK
jgi:hypothetical protein